MPSPSKGSSKKASVNIKPLGAKGTSNEKTKDPAFTGNGLTDSQLFITEMEILSRFTKCSG